MRALLIFVSILFGLASYSQKIDLSRDIDPEKQYSGSSYSLLIRNIENDSLILDFQGNKEMIPASLVKLVTAFYSFAKLGPEDTYKTYLIAYGKPYVPKDQWRALTIPRNELAKERLAVHGTGDPTFCSKKFGREADLDTLGNAVVKHGIKHYLKLTIVIPRWDRPPASGDWKYSDMGNYYAAGVYGINYLDNTYSMIFQQNEEVGSRVKLLRTEPEVLNFIYRNQVRTGPPGSGDQAYIHGAPYSNMVFAYGTIPPGKNEFRIKGSIPNPPDLFGVYFGGVLLSKGINANFETNFGRMVAEDGKQYPALRPPPVLDKAPPDSSGTDTLKIIESPPVKELVPVMLKKSDNLLAESLGRKLESERGFRIRELPDLQLRDYSGLSRSNQISSKKMVDLLMRSKDEEWFDLLLSSLPVGGETGTISYRFKGSSLSGKVYAKTGSMSGVRCLAGYIVNEGKPTHAFCYMINTDSNADALELQKRMDNYLVSLDLVH